MLVTKRIDLDQLNQELAKAAVVVPNGLGLSGTLDGASEQELFTYTVDGTPDPNLPPEAVPVVEAHVAAPPVIEYAALVSVDRIVRTTDATPKEVFRFGCDQKRVYRANLRVSGIDAGNGAAKVMEGRFVWKRLLGDAVVTGITVVSDIHDAAAAAWAPNCLPEGTDIVFTVTGAAGRTIDWLLTGEVGQFAPEGLHA